MKKKPRGKAGRRPPPPVRFARNPGIESLMVVNPGKRPKLLQGDLFKNHPKPGPKAKSKRPKARKPMRPMMPPRSMPRPAAGANVTVAVAPAAAPKIDYRSLLARPYKSKAKSQSRGVKTLARERKSILWNARVGTAGAREFLRKHFPHVNPEPSTAIAIGAGAGTFVASRVVSNLSSKIPGVSRLGMHAPVLTSALLAGLAWFATRKRPQYRTSVLTGAGLAFLDAVLRHYLPAVLPQAAGVLGGCFDTGRRLSAYDDLMGYLPADAGAGQPDMSVRESMTPDGNALVTREAMAGFAGYVPEGMSAYPPWMQGGWPNMHPPGRAVTIGPPPAYGAPTVIGPPPAYGAPHAHPGTMLAPQPHPATPERQVPRSAMYAGGIFGPGD